MAALSRMGDTDNIGGKIVRGASTVFANGIAVGLHISDVTLPPKAKTTAGSPSVFVEGVAVLRVGSPVTGGLSIVQGSPNVNCP